MMSNVHFDQGLDRSDREVTLLFGFVLAAVSLVGLALRIWHLSSTGLTHFDEGIYAISSAWSRTNGIHLHPHQHLFSPPLYVILAGLTTLVSGMIVDKSLILLNILLGTATVFSAGIITKNWYGSKSGVAAAVLVALSTFHISLSRTALTDVTFGLLFILSLAMIATAFEKQRLRWSLAAGLAVGAAWNTKYHGWLLLSVSFFALNAAVLYSGVKSRYKQLVLCWGVIVITAVMCFLPWIFYVQYDKGGFIELLKYQRDYLSFSWLENLITQLRQQWYMDGW